MTTLIEALSNGFDTVGQKKFNGEFSRKLEMYKNSVVDEYIKYNIDLNTLISKIAKRDNLNDDQIQRIVEEVNNQVYLLKYNQMKHSNDRDVVFDLASLNKVKNITSGTNTVLPSKTGSSPGDGSIEKKASIHDDLGDSMNIFNYSTHNFSSLSPEVSRNETNIALEKVAVKLRGINEEMHSTMNKIAFDASIIADALVQYSRHGIDYQSVFDEICKQSSCSPKEQLMIKNASENIISGLKSSRKISDNYEFNLQLSGITKSASEYSIGKYSFNSELGFTTRSNIDLPVVIVNNEAINNINELAKVAMSLGDNSNKYKNCIIEKEAILNESNLSSEQGEKLAELGRGVSAFGKALTGSNVRSARKALNDSAVNVINKMENKDLKAAQNAVKLLSDSKRNVDLHPRMQNVGDTLSSIIDKYDGVASATDDVLTNNALKHALNPTKYLNPSAAKARIDRLNVKGEVNRAEKALRQQASRVRSDISPQLANAQRKLKGIEAEIDIDGAKNALDIAEKAYNRAISSRKKARSVAAVGVGGVVAANELKKKKESEGNVYY